jgi:hypothetical protein
MPTLIILLMAALVVFYLASRPAATQPTLRAVPIAEMDMIRAIPIGETEQTPGDQATEPGRPTSIATSENR